MKNEQFPRTEGVGTVWTTKHNERSKPTAFPFKRDMNRAEWEQVGKEEGSCWTKDMSLLVWLLRDGQVDTRTMQSNRSARGKSNITDQKSEQTID